MSDVDPGPSSATAKKDRSPSFPYITLTKALERTRAIYGAARRHEFRIDVIGSAKSSATQQTAGALIAYGLLEDSGSGDARKFRVTDLAFRALEDHRPGAREAALSEAALKPRLIAEYAAAWRDGRPIDAICISELRIDRGFTEDGAKAFLRVYDDAIRFTAGPDSDNEGEKAAPQDVADAPSHAGLIGVGTVTPAAAPTAPPTPFAIPAMATTGENDIKIMLDGDRLRVSAVVDAKGAKRLMKALKANIALLEDDDDDADGEAEAAG